MDFLVKNIFDLLKKQKATLTFAESCTGGLVSGQFTDMAGSSEVFLGAVVPYSNDVKSEILGVSKKDLETHGAVSREVALKMAQGVRQKLKSTWSVSITGVAGPGGGSPEK